MKLKKGDQVEVILGKDKSRKGEVERVYPKSNRALVKGVNIYKKHVKKSESVPKGGVVEINRSLSVNKVMLICPSCKEKTRIGYTFDSKGQKQRICRKCQKVIK